MKQFWVATVFFMSLLAFKGVADAYGLNAIGYGAEFLLLQQPDYEGDLHGFFVELEDYAVELGAYDGLNQMDMLSVHRGQLCFLMGQVESWGYRVSGNHVCHNGPVRLFSYRMLLEELERAFSSEVELDSEQRAVLEALYDEIIAIVQLLICDVSKLDENDPHHIADVLGLLLRARYCSSSARISVFHLTFQSYLSEHRPHARADYINGWARALATVSLQAGQVHKIRVALLACMEAGESKQVREAAARAIGSLLGHVAMDAAYQAELIRSLMDLVFKQGGDTYSIRAVIEGMRRALAGRLLSKEMKALVFDALLCIYEPEHLPQVVHVNQLYLIECSLLDLWAEGLREGLFSDEEVNALVPYIMDFRFVRNCPIRTQSVVVALIGLIHARAEDSTFRQLVYGHIEDILMKAEQREEIIRLGLGQLSLLFVRPELPHWERAKIIAYFSALLPNCTGYYLSVALMDALCTALSHFATLSSRERGELLRLLRNVCVFEASHLDARSDDIIQTLNDIVIDSDFSVEEEALMMDILEALPSDDDDLDYGDDDDLDSAV